MATAIGHTIGALRVVIGADTSALKHGLREAGSGLSGLRRAAMPAIAAIAAVGTAVTAAAAGMVKLARDEMKVIDAQSKLARSMGGTVTGLRALKFAAEDAGIDGLEASLNRLNRRLGAVEMGGGPAVETVKRLGLNLAELAEMDVDDRLAHIADRIRDYGGSAQESARHLQQLGFEQKGAIELFMQGGDAIREARKEVEAFGLAVSDIDAQRMEAANSAMWRLGKIVDGLRTQLAVNLSPVILETAERLVLMARGFLRVSDNAGEASGEIQELMQSPFVQNFIRPAAVGLARLIDVLALVGRAAKAVAGSFRVVAADLSVLIDAARVATEWVSPRRIFDSSKLDAAVEQLGQTLEERNKTLEDANKRWVELWNIPANQFEQAAIAAFDAPLRMPGPRPTGGLEGGGAAPSPEGEKAAEDRRKQLADELAAIRTHLADRATLEHRAAMDRLEQLHDITKEGLIVEREQRELAIGISDRFYRTMRELRDQDFADRQRALLEQHELELLSFDEYFRARLEAAREHEESITQMAIDAFNFRRNQLQALREEGDLTEEEYRARIEDIERAHQEELTRIAAEGAAARRQVSADEAQQRQAITQGMLANLTQLMNSGNREMFRIGKIAAVAQALLKGREAVVSSYAAGARIGGPPLGAAFAATAAAATAAQISAVASTSFGGGGGVTAGSGGVAPRPTDTLPDDPVDPRGRERQAVTITLQGEIFNRQQIRDLIEQINEATADGAVLRLS